MKIKTLSSTISALLLPVMLTGCSEEIHDEPVAAAKPDWYYAGGELGTTYLSTSNAFEQPSPAVERQGFYRQFKNGEALFEKPFMTNQSGVRAGLGPVYLRTSCLHCHPGYGHGMRIPEGSFDTTNPGNGCLLVVYDPATDAYVPWLAGMPQGHAVAPFKAPLDESKVIVRWINATDGWGNRFDDGETYELQYPEVTIPKDAIYVVNHGYQLPGQYEVRLESTIGIYGTGLLDAIEDDAILAQYRQEDADGFLPNGLNPAYYAGGNWNSTYSNSLQGDGTPYARRFTYALSRGPLQDAAGANAIWNITNVTRSDRRYHYLDAAGSYAEISSKDPDVHAGFDSYIARIDPEHRHAGWWQGTIEQRILNYLLA
ncbi:MAG: hypothetical protein K2I91_03930, partial [Muribaculaceae bacterium]|nr:hypothetical protein [Muribaculaceae bacterium]